jgi:hypothetical protein
MLRVWICPRPDAFVRRCMRLLSLADDMSGLGRHDLSSRSGPFWGLMRIGAPRFDSPKSGTLELDKSLL